MLAESSSVKLGGRGSDRVPGMVLQRTGNWMKINAQNLHGLLGPEVKSLAAGILESPRYSIRLDDARPTRLDELR